VRDDLAKRVLATILGDEEAYAQVGKRLQQLAILKYNEYEGFRPGERFLESLASWLLQFESDERPTALEFVLERLVFISRPELDHLIETVYPHHLRPHLIGMVAETLGRPAYRVAEITTSVEFRDLQRKTLVFGLADGARLDRLRRASPELSHEQFFLTFEVDKPARESMRRHLSEAIEELQLRLPAVFRQVILVDDFAGSGHTAANKLQRVRGRLGELTTDGLIEPDCPVWVLLYVATSAALGAIREAAPAWQVDAVQLIPDTLRIDEPALLELSKRYFDPVLDDANMQTGGCPGYLGYAGGALPLVIHHNAPNNSLGIVWGDTTDRIGSAGRRALFPRRTRHRVDRP